MEKRMGIDFEQILNVPFKEKDRAKSLGAKWSPELKRWYIPNGADVVLFKEWTLRESTTILSVPVNICLAQSLRNCWKCEKESPVVAVAAEREVLPVIDEEHPFFLFHYIEKLPLDIVNYLQAYFPKYRLDYSKTTESRYYMNHCNYCDALFGDWYLYEEPGEPFCPTSEEEAGRVTLVKTTFEVPYRLHYGGEDGIEHFFDGIESEISDQEELLYFHSRRSFDIGNFTPPRGNQLSINRKLRDNPAHETFLKHQIELPVAGEPHKSQKQLSSSASSSSSTFEITTVFVFLVFVFILIFILIYFYFH